MCGALQHLPGKQRGHSKNDLRHPLYQRERDCDRCGDADDSTNTHKTAFLYTQPARNEESRRAHRVPKALDGERLPVANGIAHVAQRDPDLECTNEPSDEVNQGRDGDRAVATMDMLETMVQIGDAAQHAPPRVPA